MIFQKGIGDNQFPEGGITQAWIDGLQPCDLVNPYPLDHPEVLIRESISNVPQLGGEDFECEFVNVARAVHLAKQKAAFETIESQGWEWLTTKLKGGFISSALRDSFQINERYRVNYGIRNTRQLADLVHNDYPSQIIDDLWRVLRHKGYKIDKSLFPEKPYKVFTDGVVGGEAVLAVLVRKVSPTAFAHKYLHRRPRPEEVAHAWAKGDVSFSRTANEALEHYINKEQVAANPHAFTIYPEGCPTHPSLPAMHSAVAAMALVVKVMLNLDDYAENEASKLAANVAYGRTFAGVHYRLDNDYGLELGERCAAIVLPAIMAEYMGAIPERVAEKIAAKRVNWL